MYDWVQGRLVSAFSVKKNFAHNSLQRDEN